MIYRIFRALCLDDSGAVTAAGNLNESEATARKDEENISEEITSGSSMQESTNVASGRPFPQCSQSFLHMLIHALSLHLFPTSVHRGDSHPRGILETEGFLCLN